MSFTNPRFPDRREFEPDDINPFLLIPPVANFTVTAVGLTVTVQDTSTDVDGVIVSRVWDFGDVAALPTPAFRFQIQSNPLQVQFTDLSTDVAPGTVTAWAWDFGDGTTSTDQNPLHTFAAGGAYNVRLNVTDDSGNTSTSPAQHVVNVGSLGRPVGPAQLYASNTAFKGGPFSGTRDNLTPANIVARLATARDSGIVVMSNMTGGSHTQYLVNGVFSFNVWKTYMDKFKTTAIIAAVAEAVNGGWLIGNSMVDEPNNSSWGAGAFTKSLIDQMAVYGRGIFLPSVYVPMGVVSRYDWFARTKYTQCDFTNMQYSFRLPIASTSFDGTFMPADPGNVALFISRGLAQSAFDGTAPSFGMNVLGGGFRYPEDPFITTPSCPIPHTGGIGEGFATSNNCKMTPAQIEDYGIPLSDAGAILTYWSYLSDEVAFFTDPDNVAAFQAVLDHANTLSKLSLRRP